MVFRFPNDGEPAVGVGGDLRVSLGGARVVVDVEFGAQLGAAGVEHLSENPPRRPVLFERLPVDDIAGW